MINKKKFRHRNWMRLSQLMNDISNDQLGLLGHPDHEIQTLCISFFYFLSKFFHKKWIWQQLGPPFDRLNSDQNIFFGINRKKNPDIQNQFRFEPAQIEYKITIWDHCGRLTMKSLRFKLDFSIFQFFVESKHGNRTFLHFGEKIQKILECFFCHDIFPCCLSPLFFTGVCFFSFLEDGSWKLVVGTWSWPTSCSTRLME